MREPDETPKIEFGRHEICPMCKGKGTRKGQICGHCRGAKVISREKRERE